MTTIFPSWLAGLRDSAGRALPAALLAGAIALGPVPGALAKPLKPKPFDHELMPGISFEARFNLEYIREDNYDLDDTTDDLFQSIEPEGTARLGFMPDANHLFALELQLSKVFLIDPPPGEAERDPNLELKRIYFHFYDPATSTALIVGRHEYKDEVEWLYDEDLDAVRVHHDEGAWELDVSVFREELFIKNLLDSALADPIDNAMALIRFNHDARTNTDAYVLARNDRSGSSGAEDVTFFGVQSVGQLSDPLHYWFNAAYVTGERERTGADIGGFGIDGMLTYVIATRWEPSISAGFAYGSGDADTSDGSDGNFRQTDWQDNQAKLNGLKAIKYYGEVLDPELSNMMILSLGAGLRPTRNTSIDVLFHAFRQVEADDRIRDTDLNVDPTGLSDDLGQEVDVLFAWQPMDTVTLGVTGGVFFPGDAFGPGADNAYLGNVELTVKF